MSTTSGRAAAQTSGASFPDDTAATTSMSDRSPSRKSSVSRKTWLSSTMTPRIGRVTSRSLRDRTARVPGAGVLLGHEEQRIVRLPAVVHLELEPGVSLLDLCDEAGERRRLLARQEREDPSRLREHAFDDRARDLVEALASDDRLPF